LEGTCSPVGRGGGNWGLFNGGEPEGVWAMDCGVGEITMSSATKDFERDTARSAGLWLGEEVGESEGTVALG
jgi:hypothetical protein